MSLSALCLLFACTSSTEPGDTDGSGSSSTSNSTSTSGGPTTATPSSSSTSAAEGSSSEGSTSGPSTATGSDSSSEGGETTGATAEPGCPETLPDAWILCEDFEAFAGWGNFWTNDDLMAVEPGPAFSGETSLRISHQVGQYGSGMADFRFGQGPDDDIVAQPDETFREVWVRFYVRTHEDWPADRGISEGIEVMSVVGQNRSIAVDASIYSVDTAEARMLPWSCVHDSELRCSNGNGDWSNNPDLRTLAEEFGTSPLYGDELAGQWQCHEVHVRLDDPGQANGVLELWADGVLDVSVTDLEYVNAWDDAGLNTVRFASFWTNQTGLDHHIDDVVISTEPIGCVR